MSRAVRIGLASAAPLALALLPSLACACAVCFGDRDSDWTAGFVAGTILMLALPPAILVGAGLAIWRATKRQEARLTARASAGPG